MYPLSFQPIIKHRIWGGTKLNSLLNKELSTNEAGESWELSSVPNDVSVVSNGIFKGKTLTEVIATHPKEILGRLVIQRYGENFPLLFKFIDAKEDLSIQLHPNDELAKVRHNSFGKTEMWYVMQADEGAKLIVGFKENSNQKDYLEHLANDTLVNLLEEIPVKKGDVFFIETGTIHAIGAGVVLAEIQQTSDVTYRLYDWGRVDASGNGRELHTSLALDAINFNKTESKINYPSVSNYSNLVVDCPYFKTQLIPLTGLYNWQKKQESFTVFICTSGAFSIVCDEFFLEYKKGDTLLIPAAMESLVLKGEATLLEISI